MENGGDAAIVTCGLHARPDSQAEVLVQVLEKLQHVRPGFTDSVPFAILSEVFFFFDELSCCLTFCCFLLFYSLLIRTPFKSKQIILECLGCLKGMSVTPETNMRSSSSSSTFAMDEKWRKRVY